MIRPIRAELFKLRTTPGPWVTLGATLVFTALGIAASFLIAHGAGHVRFVAPRTVPRLRQLLGAGMAVGGVWMAAIIGVLSSTGDDRHKILSTSLLVTPRRPRLVAAKAVAAVLWAIAIAVASLLLVAAMGIPLLHTQGGSVSALLHQAGAVLPGLFGAFALQALFGTGVGTLLRNQLGAVVTVLAIPFIVEPVFDGLLPEVGRWLPFAASAAVAGDLTPVGLHRHLLSPWLAAIVLAAWGLAPTVLGTFATFKRDVT